MPGPSRLWGYVLLKDPNTNEYHWPYSKDSATTPTGYPQFIKFNFTHTSGTRQSISFNGDIALTFGLDAAGKPSRDVKPPVGGLYSIIMLEDPNQTDPPRIFTGTIPNKDIWTNNAIVSGPGWSFANVETGDFRIKDADGSVAGPTSFTRADDPGWRRITLTASPPDAKFPNMFP